MKHSKKIIVFTTENRQWGGSELLWSEAARHLSTDHTVYVCVYSDLNIPDWFVNDASIVLNVLPVPKLRKLGQFLNRFLPYARRIRPKNKRHLLLEQLQPDLLVINQGFNFNGVDLMQFAIDLNIKYVTISQAVNESLWPNTKLRQQMQSGFVNSLRNYFVSKDNEAVTEAQLGITLRHSEVVRNPFNVPYHSDLDYPKHENYWHLACVGRYDFDAKGQDVLLRVLAQDKWKQRPLIVNFYGQGKDEENLKDLISLYGLTNVKVHGHTPTLDIWKQNEGLVLTSRYEGLPIVIVEAMLCKRFSVVTNVSGSKELIKDNDTGFIAAAPRPEYVDEALERAWCMKDEWMHIGARAHASILEQIPEDPALVLADKLIMLID